MKNKNKPALLCAQQSVCFAFSLVELMVTLIIISCLVAILAPVITKKLKSNILTINPKAGLGEMSTDCKEVFNSDCKLCNINFCLDCEKTCAEGYFKNISRCECENCTKYDPNCATCDSIKCLTCMKDYKFDENKICKLAAVTKEYTTAGNHNFIVPAGVTELEVTLVSGGAGGGGGAYITKTDTFVTSGNGNVATEDSNNNIHRSSSGIITWTIPQIIKGKQVLVSACGGGGGGGSTEVGGAGGAIKDAAFTMPNWNSIKIHIGGGGGFGGGDGYIENTCRGNCSLGGSGAARQQHTTCNASGNWGKGGISAPRTNQTTQYPSGNAGYDPVYFQHGVGGGAGYAVAATGSITGYSGQSGNGSRVGGGGGAACTVQAWTLLECPYDWCWSTSKSGGGGGAATLFYHSEYAKTASIVAPGGGGGGGYWCGSGYCCMAPGGGGGGIGAGNGGTTGAGGAGRGSNNSIFGSNYCHGGSMGQNGQNGAMRITYYDTPNGGSGGGSGQIVPKQKIAVVPGETLTITVGQGGAGGALNARGQGANANIVSKISRSNGVVLITTATNVGAQGTTGGYSNGTSAGAKGFITNGKNATQITYSGFSNTNGATTTAKSGGQGGRTTIEGAENLCSPGGGGAEGVAGGDAAGYGGCGGGGGGAGAAGGKGSVGYVKIKYGT